MDAGADIVGVDQSGGMLRQAQAKFPDVAIEKTGLQEISFASQFDGAICIDAMENVSPEDWPGVLANLSRAVRPGSPVYLTVELAEDDLAEVYAFARAAGQPVVSGEYLRDGGYHFHPRACPGPEMDRRQRDDPRRRQHWRRLLPPFVYDASHSQWNRSPATAKNADESPRV